MNDKEKALTELQSEKAVAMNTVNDNTSSNEESISYDEAHWIITRMMMDMGMFMPIEWVRENGAGSKTMKAVKLALDLIEEKMNDAGRSR